MSFHRHSLIRFYHTHLFIYTQQCAMANRKIVFYFYFLNAQTLKKDARLIHRRALTQIYLFINNITLASVSLSFIHSHSFYLRFFPLLSQYECVCLLYLISYVKFKLFFSFVGAVHRINVLC